MKYPCTPHCSDFWPNDEALPDGFNSTRRADTRADAQFDPDFDRVLAEFSAPYDGGIHKGAPNRIIAQCPGIKTMAGVRSIVNGLLKPPAEGISRNDIYKMLHRSEIPPEQIVSYLLEVAATAARRRDPSDLVSYYWILDDFPQDDRVVRFFAANLDDKRQPLPSPPGPRDEPDGQQTYRVCDQAFTSLIEVLEKRGEIKPGDPGYGDPGGEALRRQRDRNIAALKPLLVKSGYLNDLSGSEATTTPLIKAVPAPDPTPAPSLAIGVPIEEEPAPLPSVSPKASQPLSSSGRWFAWLILVIFAVGVMGWFA